MSDSINTLTAKAIKTESLQNRGLIIQYLIKQSTSYTSHTCWVTLQLEGKYLKAWLGIKEQNSRETLKRIAPGIPASEPSLQQSIISWKVR